MGVMYFALNLHPHLNHQPLRKLIRYSEYVVNVHSSETESDRIYLENILHHCLSGEKSENCVEVKSSGKCENPKGERASKASLQKQDPGSPRAELKTWMALTETVA